MKLYYKRICSLFLILALNISCSITTLPHEVKTSINNAESDISNLNNKLNQPQNSSNENYIEHRKTGYFGNQVIVNNDTDYLPTIFNNPIQIDKEFYSLHSVTGTISDLTGIPTILDLSSNIDSCTNIRITQQQGTLIDLLNNLGARCDLSWSYKDSKIILSDLETKTWAINGIPGDIQIQNQINNSTGIQGQSGASGGSIGNGGGGAATGQSQANSSQSTTQTIAFNLQNSLWQNMSDAIKSMLSRTGRLSISPATSSLTVTDRPSVLLRVDRYIRNQNGILGRQVQIDVQVLNVEVNSEDNYGINWNLLLQGANTKFSINGQAVTPSANGTSAFSPSPIFVPTNTTQAFTIGATGASLNGSQLIINALSSNAKTSLVTSTAVTTLSNQPVPVQFVDQLSYLASVTTTQTANVGSQTSLTPGELTTGFSLNVLPVIQSDGKVNLQLSLNISALKNMAQYSTTGASVELPETLQRNFMQKVIIKSGDTFVVTGFDSDSNQLTKNGVGGANNWWFGGGVSSKKTRSRLVILVTPRVIT